MYELWRWLSQTSHRSSRSSAFGSILRYVTAATTTTLPFASTKGPDDWILCTPMSFGCNAEVGRMRCGVLV